MATRYGQRSPIVLRERRDKKDEWLLYTYALLFLVVGTVTSQMVLLGIRA